MWQQTFLLQLYCRKYRTLLSVSIFKYTTVTYGKIKVAKYHTDLGIEPHFYLTLLWDLREVDAIHILYYIKSTTNVL